MIKIGTSNRFASMSSAIMKIGIRIVKITIAKSISIALFFKTLVFLFRNTEPVYNIKFIMLELSMFEMLVPISPLADEKQTVKSSGTEVANPEIFPTVFGFKFNVSANFLSNCTNIYFEIRKSSFNLSISLILYIKHYLKKYLSSCALFYHFIHYDSGRNRSI